MLQHGPRWVSGAPSRLLTLKVSRSAPERTASQVASSEEVLLGVLLWERRSCPHARTLGVIHLIDWVLLISVGELVKPGFPTTYR